ncbi:hypothetical protein LCGC14_2915210, partial [marine sediment metagenome]
AVLARAGEGDRGANARVRITPEGQPETSIVEDRGNIVRKYDLGTGMMDEKAQNAIVLSWGEHPNIIPILAEDEDEFGHYYFDTPKGLPVDKIDSLTDEEADRRVAGYQFQINTEVIRSKRAHFQTWVMDSLSDVPEPGRYELSQANVQRFCELFQDRPTEERPEGWYTRPFPLIELPLRLKRKLCIEWNHLYLEWMEENDIQYDFEKKFFSTESDYEEEPPDLTYPEGYLGYLVGWG